MWTFSDDGAEIRGSKTAFFSPSDESSRSESIWKIQSFQNQINLKRTDYCSWYSDAMIIHSIYGQLSVWGKRYLFCEIPASSFSQSSHNYLHRVYSLSNCRKLLVLKFPFIGTISTCYAKSWQGLKIIISCQETFSWHFHDINLAATFNIGTALTLRIICK